MPLSIGIALFMTEVAPQWLKRPVVAVLDLLAVVPSVVFGLWGILVLAEPIGDFYDHVSERARTDPAARASSSTSRPTVARSSPPA